MQVIYEVVVSNCLCELQDDFLRKVNYMYFSSNFILRERVKIYNSAWIVIK